MLDTLQAALGGSYQLVLNETTSFNEYGLKVFIVDSFSQSKEQYNGLCLQLIELLFRHFKRP